MSISKIVHVDVIADASAVGGLVVIAEDLQSGPLALNRLEDERDQVSLRVMVLADFRALVCSRRIEVSEAHKAQSISEAVGFQRILECELGRSVRIHWLTRITFRYGHFHWIAVDRTG